MREVFNYNTMLIKGIIEEDFLNYKSPCMFILFPHCDFKCDRENGNKVCQNSKLVTSPDIDIPINKVVSKYIKNDITKAIVCGGLEPFNSWDDLFALIKSLREKTDDDIVIYTGFNKQEISYRIFLLQQFKNIIIKFGRFIPNNDKHYDSTLGVYLASDNQYSEKIS